MLDADYDFRPFAAAQGQQIDNAGRIHRFSIPGDPDFVLCILGDFRYLGSGPGMQAKFVDDHHGALQI